METKGLFIRLSESGDALEVPDVTCLPMREKWLTLKEEDEIFEAVHSGRVRGEGAVTLFAAYALYVLTVRRNAPDYKSFLVSFKEHCTRLLSLLPDSEYLKHAILECILAVQKANPQTVKVSADAIRLTAERLTQENEAICRALSQNALTLVKPSSALLTHGEDGPLSASRIGVTLGVFLLGQEQGMRLSAYCTESRPTMLGARLTSATLRRAGVRYTVVSDTAVFSLLQSGKVDAVFVGCERVLRDGSVTALIGSAQIAALCKLLNVPFYVCAPTFAVCPKLEKDAVTTENTLPADVYERYFAEPVCPAGSDVFCPKTELVSPDCISAIITEKEILRAPYSF
ncbi:MAG: hypothetical protein IKT43_02610 [Clostridia bacterium]|nr:hypothetical protein [Clostridia bacterium]